MQLMLLLACVAEPGPPASGSRCIAPGTGLELVDVAAERGLVHVVEAPGAPMVDGGAVVAEDLDGDGDVDIALGRSAGWPAVFRNDDGWFTEVEPGPPLDAPLTSHAVADLDGDGVPELLLLSPGLVRVAENLGDLSFGPPQVAIHLPDDLLVLSVAVGDLDGDGWLDVVVPGLDRLDGTPVAGRLHAGSLDRVYLQRDGELRLAAELSPEAGPGLSMAALLLDDDGDGDLDVFIAADRAQLGMPPSALYRNDGLGSDGALRLVDVTSERGAGLSVSAMGLATADLDGDGLLDLCLTDIGGLACLGSTSEPRARVEQALGLAPPAAGGTAAGWMGWSLELADLDADGWVDGFAAAGLAVDVPGGWLDGAVQADALWHGGEQGFVEVGALYGVDDVRHHVGAAAADLDGDGFIELVVGGVDGPALLLDGGCTEHGWLEVRLEGPDGNRLGVGATVEVVADGHAQRVQLHGPRVLGQGPARAHVGLGQAESAVVRVWWPDGEVTELDAVPAREVLVVRHPRAGGPP